MKFVKTFTLLLLIVLIAPPLFAQTSTWNHRFGGPSEDFVRTIEATSDGGYLIAGSTRSFGAGAGDAWVVRLDGSGNIIWQYRYGGGQRESISSVRQTTDGGFILAGNIMSGPESTSDAWLLRLSANGDVIWQRTYGGKNADRFYSVQPQTDGQFVAGGETSSFGSGQSDGWIVQVNSTGDITMQHTFGSPLNDGFRTISNTTDGGWIAAGKTAGFGAQNFDGWLMRFNSQFGILWQRRFGSTGDDVIHSASQTRDGGFIFSGSIATDQQSDGWIVRINSAGNNVWQRKVGRFENDWITSVQQTLDGGYVAAGISILQNNNQTWLIRLNPAGKKLWQNLYGNAAVDSTPSVRQTRDGGYVLSTDLKNNTEIDGAIFKLDRSGKAGTACASLITQSTASLNSIQSEPASTNAPAEDSNAKSTRKSISRKTSSAVSAEACRTDVPPSMRTGTFVPNPSTDYTVQGTAVLQRGADGSLELIFGSDFLSSNGPRLEVYLSTTSAVNPGFTTLGRLKNTLGTQSYVVPSGIMLDSYSYVLIHCVSFNVTFGHAKLQ